MEVMSGWATVPLPQFIVLPRIMTRPQSIAAHGHLHLHFLIFHMGTGCSHRSQTHTQCAHMHAHRPEQTCCRSIEAAFPNTHVNLSVGCKYMQNPVWGCVSKAWGFFLFFFTVFGRDIEDLNIVEDGPSETGHGGKSAFLCTLPSCLLTCLSVPLSVSSDLCHHLQLC